MYLAYLYSNRSVHKVRWSIKYPKQSTMLHITSGSALYENVQCLKYLPQLI